MNNQGRRGAVAGEWAFRFAGRSLLVLIILFLPPPGLGQDDGLRSSLFGWSQPVAGSGNIPSNILLDQNRFPGRPWSQRSLALPRVHEVGPGQEGSSGGAGGPAPGAAGPWRVLSFSALGALALVLLAAGLLYVRGLRRHRAELVHEVSLKNDALVKLSSSEQLLRELAGNINAVFFICDTDYAGIRYLSPVFEKWWGISIREITENPSAWMEAVHPDDIVRVSEELQHFKDDPPNTDHLIRDYRIISPDGKLRWVQTRFHPVPDREGKTRRLCGLIEDITEQMQARERLNLLLSDHRDITDNIRDIIFKLSTEGNITWCNRRMLGLTTRPESGLIGESVFNLVHDQDQGTLANVLLLTRKIGEAKAEVRFRRPLGYSLYQLSTVDQAADDNRAETVICIGRDITYHRQAELETIELHRQLQHAQKMEAIGNLSGGIAHDFNNILSSILGYADLARLAANKGATAKVADYLQEVVVAGKLATELVDKMLMFTRKHSDNHNASLSLPAGLHEVIKLMRPMLPSSLSIHIDAERRARRVAISDVDFQQLIMNLLINARDAMLGRGNIRIDCRMVELEAMECSSCRRSFSGNYLKVSITDHGSGIADGNLDKIFHPFFTTKPPGKGTGLGLSIVHGIMHSRHGHIRVSAGPEGGSMFELFLYPADRERRRMVRRNHVALPVVPPQPGHNRILLVDDEIKVGMYLKEMLQEKGYLVDYRTDPVDALNMYSNLPGNFDLVITDQTMPHITGMDLARHIKQLQPDCPVILCTGYSDILSRQQLDEFSIPLCQKPLDTGILLDHINRLLH